MPWLVPSIIATAAGTALLTFVYYYLYFLDRKNYLRIWAISWAVYFLRFVFDIVMLITFQNQILQIGNQLASLFSGIIMLWGTYEFMNKRFPKTWLFLSALGAIWIIISISLKFSFFLISIPTFTFLAIVYVWTGITFIKTEVTHGIAKNATGIAFIIWGVHKMNYPFLRPVVWFAPWGFLLSAMLEFIVALGILLVYFQKVRDDLKNEEHFLQKAQEIGKVGTWELNIQKNQLLWTEENYKIFGIPLGTNLTYETFLDCVHPDDRDYVDRTWEGALDKKPYDIVHRLIVDNKIKWVREKAELEFDEKGNCVRGIGVTQDITERKNAEEEKSKLEAQLQQAQKMESVGRLAGGVAHDFNNMLSVIIGNAEMVLEDMAPDDPFHENLSEIFSAARRSADITQQLLTFARKQTIAPKVLDLNDTIESMLKMLRRLIGEDIDLAWLPGKNVWPVRMDPSQIDQILANLCVNARDAIANVGNITIETETITFDSAYCAENPGFVTGDFVLLAVSDDGSGMDQETRANLFEPFFTTKELGKGTGLGLATIFGIVKQNNGFINVYSEPGQGSTFKIYLPRYLTKPESPEIKTSDNINLVGKETILLVEDEHSIL